jgi:hypothetical protein
MKHEFVGLHKSVLINACTALGNDNLELGLSASGELVVMAGTAVEQLSLMRGGAKQRLDYLSISERVPI